jgi:PIN domain nuclease of toxin-antitoxin system
LRYLLDTHIWLWLLDSPTKIASPIRTALGAADELVLSVASVWEIAIKVKLGKLVVQGGVDAARQEMLTAIGARELAITSTHALAAADLPALHRDPFDRILVAQAIVEGLVLVTADEMVRQYSAPTQWAL